MAERPLVTIAIPSYNSAGFLADSVGSAMRQGLDDFEILILDNASKDDTEQVVRSFDNPRIRYLRNPTNVGSRENGNRCLQEARGVYLKFLCADDVLVDGMLPKMLDALISQPNVSLASCNMYVTDSELQGATPYRFFPGECSGPRVMNACLSGMANYIGGPSNFMFRLDDVAGVRIDPKYHFVSDLRLGLQLLERGDYKNIDEFGVLYRRHGASDTATNCPEDLQVPEHIGLVEEFDWWNPLNCLKSLRDGGPKGKEAVSQHWLAACRPANLKKAMQAFSDVTHMRNLAKQDATAPHAG